MKIISAKLKNGTYLVVSYHDGVAIVDKSYPQTEAAPKLLKAFMSLNHHLCDLTEQCDSTGQGDYDNIAARSYSIKGNGKKEGITITGIRTLATGRTIILNAPFISMDIDSSSYPNIKSLIDCLNRCQDEISSFMTNNKSQEELQGSLFDTSKSTYIVKSPHTEHVENETAIGIVFKDVIAKIKENAQTPDDIQNGLDEEMPLNKEMAEKNKSRKSKSGAKKH